MRKTALEVHASLEDNPRPAKRARIDASGGETTTQRSISHPESDQKVLLSIANAERRPRPPLSTTKSKAEARSLEEQDPNSFEPLSRPGFLFAMPTIFSHPPAHDLHRAGLWMGIYALRALLGVGPASTVKEDAFTPQKEEVDVKDADGTEKQELSAQEECRAWTEIAELGVRLGLDEEGVLPEVERAVGRALPIAQRHPSLRHAIPSLTRLSALVATSHGNTRFAQGLLKKLTTSAFLLPSDPPSFIYSTHLNYISSLGSAGQTGPTTILSPVKKDYNPQSANYRVFTAIRDLQSVAEEKGHEDIVLLARVMELHEYVTAGFWTKVEEALLDVEGLLGTDLEVIAPASGEGNQKESEMKDSDVAGMKEKPKTKTKIAQALEVLVLIIGVTFYTHKGDGDEAQLRMKGMHDRLDGGALAAFGKDGVVEIDFNDGASTLPIQLTHPRIVFGLGFLVSSIAKRDPVGKKPKRKLFANEGLLVLEKEVRKEVHLPSWASDIDLGEHLDKILAMKADMLCEVIGVSIARSEFEEAQKNLNILISHARTYNLFSFFSARISLHHAHLAHAQGNSERARMCYDTAVYLSRPQSERNQWAKAGSVEAEGVEDRWVWTSARLGRLWLKVGLVYERMANTPWQPPAVLPDDGEQDGWEEESVSEESEKEGSATEEEEDCERTPKAARKRPLIRRSPKPKVSRQPPPPEHPLLQELKALRKEGAEVIRACDGIGGALRAAAAVLDACLAEEFLGTKAYLKDALSACTVSQDNHLRALVFALVAAQYVHTSAEHAQTMLATAETLASGMGGGMKKVKDGNLSEIGGRNGEFGNVFLRLWVGEQSVELQKRLGDEKGAEKQAKLNELLRTRVDALRPSLLSRG